MFSQINMIPIICSRIEAVWKNYESVVNHKIIGNTQSPAYQSQLMRLEGLQFSD